MEKLKAGDRILVLADAVIGTPQSMATVLEEFCENVYVVRCDDDGQECTVRGDGQLLVG